MKTFVRSVHLVKMSLDVFGIFRWYAPFTTGSSGIAALLTSQI